MEYKAGERIGFNGGVLTECKLKVAKYKPGQKPVKRCKVDDKYYLINNGPGTMQKKSCFVDTKQPGSFQGYNMLLAYLLKE